MTTIPDTWLTLMDYAAKYRVSVTTLRRRIRSESVEHLLEHGRYFLPDRPLAEAAGRTPNGQDRQGEETSKPPAPAREAEPPHRAGEPAVESYPNDQNASRFNLAEEEQMSRQPDIKVLTDQADAQQQLTRELLQEIKLAYRTVLQEKEEQIILLKTELADLQTLVRALESENERMKGYFKPAPSLDQ